MQIAALSTWNINWTRNFQGTADRIAHRWQEKGKISDSDSTNSPLDSQYPDLLVILPYPYTKGDKLHIFAAGLEKRFPLLSFEAVLKNDHV